MLAIDNKRSDWGRIVPTTGEVETILDGYANFIDGPVWDPDANGLVFTEAWMNRSRGKIWRWRPSGEVELLVDGCKALGATLDSESRIVVAGWGGRSIWRREHDGSSTVLASQYGPLRINTPNDLVAHSSGAIYWTDPSTAIEGNGRGADASDNMQRYLSFTGVFRVWPGSGHVDCVVEDFISPNGIAFSPDEKTLYIDDTLRLHIRAFDVLPDGMLTNGRLFYKWPADLPGHFDGMKVDIEGNVYCTGPGGIHVISPEGDLIVRLRFPVPIGNLCWGGPDWRWMFCTCREKMYRFSLNIPGVPTGRRS